MYVMAYLTDDNYVKYALESTGLSIDELESIVGRFRPDHHSWPNKLKGAFVVNWDGDMKIIHHFTKKVLWTNK